MSLHLDFNHGEPLRVRESAQPREEERPSDGCPSKFRSRSLTVGPAIVFPVVDVRRIDDYAPHSGIFGNARAEGTCFWVA